ncbi:SagB family peptide dehydrogenase [Acrocarpospora macrocephala]|uniref:NADH oxidase n=1 Tax=Acrocarpospora macrocephala TaxID=150177 RepID=A0A5M3WXD1_9ACTN|nr:SagB family peptide dehydrogenase [Acrocarpospora macrocephala]GES11971.1 NADH oxidase [Acrocarpospora macrocephala]
MVNSDIALIRDYAEAVFRRGREPMEPFNFQPDWDDGPSKIKTYGDVITMPLPHDHPPLRPLAATATLPDTEGPWSFTSLATLLRMSYSTLCRRLEPNWNQDTLARVGYDHAVWGRGTASGGGLYPLEIYWVSGATGPLLPGVYHYVTGSHALERLLVGDLTERVRAATGHHPSACETDQFLLISVKFWKNAFKYNSFAYHVVTQDVGALLTSWELIARALRMPLRRVMWFADRALNDLLGLDTLGESVLAVVPLPWAGPGPDRVLNDAAPRVTKPAFERSRTVISFPTVEKVHLAALVDAGEARPDPEVARSAAPPAAPPAARPQEVPLPPPVELGMDLGEALAKRRSAFGGFAAAPPLTAAELGGVLRMATAARHYRADIHPAADPGPLTRLFVMVHRVAGVPTGGYVYLPERHALDPVEIDPDVREHMPSFLQGSYFLTNYNLDRVGAVVAITARLDPALAAFGKRGYRILNAEVGGLAQAGYLAATAAGVSCGAVLGLDNVTYNGVFHLDGTDERTFLFLLLGRGRTASAELDYRL